MEKTSMAALVIAFLVVGAGVLAFGTMNGNDNDNYLYDDDEIRVEQLGEYTFKFIAKGPKTAERDTDMAKEMRSQEMMANPNEGSDGGLTLLGSGDDAADLAVAKDGWWIGGDFYYGMIVIHTFSERELTGAAENLVDSDSMIRDAEEIRQMSNNDDSGGLSISEKMRDQLRNEADESKVRIHFSHTFYDTLFFIEFDPAFVDIETDEIMNQRPQDILQLLN